MANDVTTYLKYASLQMAAESLFGMTPTSAPGTIVGPESMTQASLILGNQRSSLFPTDLASQFLAGGQGWTVVQHESNTTTGFSGTLFKYTGETDPARGLVKDELVLSFRSTEFIDDAVRDNQATNAMEVKPYGWAFGQIADMKNWVDSLYASNQIPGGSALTVTGYSLGAHLATAFNMLYPGAVAATYTFNGAGVGTTTNGVSLSTTISQFDQMRNASADLSAQFTDADVRSLYQSLRGVHGGDGDDDIVGQGGDDELYGGSDDDWLRGDDKLTDTPVSIQGDDCLDGGAGNDNVVGGGRSDTLFGGIGEVPLDVEPCTAANDEAWRQVA